MRARVMIFKVPFKHILTRFVVSSLLILQIHDCLHAQKLVFNKIITPEETSFGVVTGITQDSEGYIWLSTNKGIYKYDGYKLTNFKNDPINPKSISSNHAECLLSNPDGTLWIGTLGAGLDLFDPKNNTFKHYRFIRNDPGSLSNDSVTSIIRDRKGTIWVGTHGGLNRWDAEKKRFSKYKHDPKNPLSLSSNQVRVIYEDRKGTLWIGTGSAFPSDGGLPEEGGLNRFDRTTGKFTRYLHDPKNPKSLFNNKVRAIYEDREGNFWVGTKSNGLHTMHRKSGVFTRHLYDPNNPSNLSRPYLKGGQMYEGGVSFIHEDAVGAIWIGAWVGGVNRYDPKSKKMSHYEASDTAQLSFKDNGSWCAFTSREGLLWIGTNEGNLYTLDPLRQDVPHSSSPQGTSIISFEQDGTGTLWVGTENGLYMKRSANQSFSRKNVSGTAPGKEPSIFDIMEDKQRRLWVATEGDGLSVFSSDRVVLRKYRHIGSDKNSLSSNNVTRVYQDYEGTVWVGTFKGLNKLNSNERKFTRFLFTKDTANVSSNTITTIYKDRQDEVWVGTWRNGGVQKLNERTGRFKNYLNGTSVMSLYKDSRGILWVGGDDGLYRLDPSSDTFIKFSDVSSPIAINNVGNLMEDDNTHLWFTSNLGIIKLNLSRNETSIFGKNHGVIVDDLDYFSGFKGRDKKIYLADANGYFAFSPEQLTKVARPPIISIRNFRLADRDVQVARKGILKQPLSTIKKIQLRYNQDVFSFDFAVLDYTYPRDNRHIFMLENFDNGWRRAGTEGRAYYFNVPAGKYIFRVKGANSRGLWSERAIEIIISPPWWRTWWAYILFFLSAVALISGFANYRARNLLLDKRKLEEKINIRTAEIVRQKEELAAQRDSLEQALSELRNAQAQLIQSEKMASLGELTAGIAHEIQNPLNFVNNFSEVSAELIDDMEKELEDGDPQDAKIISADIKENLKKILSHGKRADAIVKGMLQHSRSSSGAKESTDINSLADEYLRLSYFGLRAKDKTFNAVIDTDLDPSLEKINVVPQDIGRVLLNLLNNAFYSVGEKKKLNGESFKPMVKLSTKKQGRIVEIRVRDNGLGMSKQLLDKIYEPFFTTKPAGHGTGLGLSLSYEIITKDHNGELEVDTVEGEFAEFIIRLPTP